MSRREGQGKVVLGGMHGQDGVMGSNDEVIFLPLIFFSLFYSSYHYIFHILWLLFPPNSEWLPGDHSYQ